jgi:hypothetical protein
LEKYVGNLTAETTKFSGGLALGYSGGLGVNYTLNDKIGLFAELNFTNMVYAPTKGELTKSTKNGINQLPSLTISQKEFEYLENFTINGPNPPLNQPRKVTKFSVPMNTFGINIGIQYGF